MYWVAVAFSDCFVCLKISPVRAGVLLRELHASKGLRTKLTPLAREKPSVETPLGMHYERPSVAYSQ